MLRIMQYRVAVQISLTILYEKSDKWLKAEDYAEARPNLRNQFCLS